MATVKYADINSLTRFKEKLEAEIPDISGKQDKIDSSHKLSSDLVDDTNKTNKFTTSAEKTYWNSKISPVNVNAENTSITLNNTIEYKLNTTLKGNTSQNGTPTPSNPIDVNVVSGNNTITISDNNSHSEIYNINLPSGMELCKIGTYQDYIYKNGDKWYLHKETNKIVLDGSEADISYSLISSNSNENYIQINGTLNANNIKDSESGSLLYSDRFIYYSKATASTKAENGIRLYSTNVIVFSVSTSIATTKSAFTSWLSSNNTTVYYVLNTATNTEITDTTLISQLNALYNAKGYNTQTNISQTNNDLPFIIYAEQVANLSDLDSRIIEISNKINNLVDGDEVAY